MSFVLNQYIRATASLRAIINSQLNSTFKRSDTQYEKVKYNLKIVSSSSGVSKSLIHFSSSKMNQDYIIYACMFL